MVFMLPGMDDVCSYIGEEGRDARWGQRKEITLAGTCSAPMRNSGLPGLLSGIVTSKA